jgi:hypothetical protein
MELRDGARLVYSSRTESEDRLTHAIELYDRISESSASIGGLLHERVLLGKAHAHEILLSCSKDVNEFKGHYTEAVATLLELTSSSTSPSITSAAEQRRKMLVKYGSDIWTEGDSSPGSFYSWLSNYQPPENLPDLFPSNPSPPGAQPPVTPFPDPGELLPPPVLTPPTGGDAASPSLPEGSDNDPEEGETDEDENPPKEE